MFDNLEECKDSSERVWYNSKIPLLRVQKYENGYTILDYLTMHEYKIIYNEEDDLGKLIYEMEGDLGKIMKKKFGHDEIFD